VFLWYVPSMGRVRVLGDVTCHTWANKGQLGMHVLMGFLFLWVLWVPALQDGRVSASAAYDGRSGVQGRIFVNGVCSDSMLCEFENDTSTSA